MSIESALYGYLSVQSAITSLVSTRIHPGARPQSETFPYIVFSRDSSEHVNGWGGPAGLVKRGVEFSSYAQTYLEAIQVGEAIRTTIGNFRGTMGSEFIQSCLLSTTDAVFEERPQDGGEHYVYRDRKVFQIWHTESVPS